MKQHTRSNLFDIRMMIGLFIIVVGVGLLLENMGIVHDMRVWDWWPAILILLGLGYVIRPQGQKQVLSGIIIAAIGMVLLGNNLDWFYLDFSDLWPVILILIGLAIILHHHKVPSAEKGESNIDDEINLSLILGGGEYFYTSQHLKGGRINAILGGANLDLRRADMEGNEITLDVFCLMGGLDLRIPETWTVDIKVMPILGGVSNKIFYGEVGRQDSTRKIIHITGTTILGGVEIKN